jgi:hypothetical protein
VHWRQAARRLVQQRVVDVEQVDRFDVERVERLGPIETAR